MFSILRNILIASGASVLVVSAASAASKKSTESPETCRDGFSCGAMAARLEYPEALTAMRRAVGFDKKMFEVEYAAMLVYAGPARGGDPAKGMAMLEALCKEQQEGTASNDGTDRSTVYHHTHCSTLARMADRPPSHSGLTRDAAKAERIYRAECERGDSIMCSRLRDVESK